MKQSYFLSQPHQPFFILGLINAIIMMLFFALSYKGISTLTISTLNFHVYTLIFTVFTNFFTGFLFTTFPKFCHDKSVNKEQYINIFLINTSASLLYIIGAFISPLFSFMAMSILFITQVIILYKLFIIYRDGIAKDKKDAFWILIALHFGVLSHLLFLVSFFYPELQTLAINSAFYMYVIFLVFAVGQRMIPFFSHSFEPKSKYLMLIAFFLFTLKTLLSSYESNIFEIGIDFILGAFLLREILRWHLSPFSAPSILWVLHLGIFWLPSAFFISSITNAMELFLNTSFFFLSIHLLAIGFLTTIMVGFGIRVTLGHSGHAPSADSFATSLFILVQLIVFTRLFYSVNIAFHWNLEFLFDISFTLWILLFVLWNVKFAKILIFKKESQASNN